MRDYFAAVGISLLIIYSVQVAIIFAVRLTPFDALWWYKVLFTAAVLSYVQLRLKRGGK